jgi:hypothetical protein
MHDVGVIDHALILIQSNFSFSFQVFQLEIFVGVRTPILVFCGMEVSLMLMTVLDLVITRMRMMTLLTVQRKGQSQWGFQIHASALHMGSCCSIFLGSAAVIQGRGGELCGWQHLLHWLDMNSSSHRGHTLSSPSLPGQNQCTNQCTSPGFYV